MADENLFEKVHDLSDLELAVLLGLIAREHCLISTPEDGLDDLIEELQLVASKTFGLNSVVVHCDSSTTLDAFASALLVAHPQTPGSFTPLPNIRSESYFSSRPRHHQLPPAGDSSLRIANVVLAKNLDRAPHAVQIQALELLRTRRIFTRTAVHAAPKRFLFVPVLAAESGGEARVTRHLNDFFLLTHWHGPEDGYVNLEEEGDGGVDDETASTGSVVKAGVPGPVMEALISENDINHLAKLSQQVVADVDVIRYQMNIISFLRMHRAVADGISPAATKHLERLARCLAPLHNVDYVTPALVGLAARKVYLHRIRITAPEKERSMQWGSKLKAVEAVLDGVGPEEVIEDVLAMVTAPL